MQTVAIINTTHPTQTPVRAKYCSSFLCKFRGLMFRRNLESHEGVLLVESSDSRMNASIHMFFMWMDLCVVWINNQCQVVDVKLARRWHPAYAPKAPARYILETHPDRLKDFQIGDQISFHYD